MRPGQTSHELLSHFDRPKVVCPDFEWDESAMGPPGFERAALGSEAPADPHDNSVGSERPVRDARWVLKWAAALAIIASAARFLAEFASTVATEQALHQAAEAGVVEATLPRASRQSVLATVERRLSKRSIDPRHVNLTLLENEIPITGRIHPMEGDRISVILSANIGSTGSSWFKRNGQAPLTVRTDREVPGRRLRPRNH